MAIYASIALQGKVIDGAYVIRQDVLSLLSAYVGDSIRGLLDAALPQLAYNTFCRSSELVTLQIDDVVTAPYADGRRHSILLRKNKVDQEERGR